MVVETILKVEALKKKYGQVEAVRELNLEVKKGEILGFLGPNGAGKTTTMKVCAGLLRPTQGKVFIGGFDITATPAQAKSLLGYVPDQPLLYEKLTGREFVNFIARLYLHAPKGLTNKIEEYFILFEMKDKVDDLIQSYSRGMKQKTAIIAALVHNPQLLLVDEPTANLDPRSARIVKDIFFNLKKQGKTVFLSTHIMEIAERLCDRIAIIYRGELKAIGTMEDLKSKVKRGGSLEDIFLEVTKGKDENLLQILAEITKEEL